jgi:putative membrane protein
VVVGALAAAGLRGGGDMSLKQEDAHRIEQVIQAAEAKTSSEIVVCVRRTSGEDRGIAALVGVVILALASGLGEALWPEVDIFRLLAGSLAAGIGAFLLADWLDLGLKLLPARLVAQDARRTARAMFLDRGLDATPERNAVLLFISRAERYVEILPDRGLAAQVPAQRWAEIVTSFQATARQKGMADAAADAICKIGDVCAAVFPAGGTNPNTISDHLTIE